jgi:uncharacterized membrane protein YkvA (DUF1232 family)
MLRTRFSSPDRPPRRFARFEREAQEVVHDPERVRSLVQRAFDKISKYRSEIGEIGAELPVLLRLARSWANGEYRRIPVKAIVMIVAAALYFINPLDLIPDFLPVIGYVDDAAVVGFVLKALRREIDLYRAWESDHLLTS